LQHDVKKTRQNRYLTPFRNSLTRKINVLYIPRLKKTAATENMNNRP